MLNLLLIGQLVNANRIPRWQLPQVGPHTLESRVFEVQEHLDLGNLYQSFSDCLDELRDEDPHNPHLIHRIFGTQIHRWSLDFLVGSEEKLPVGLCSAFKESHQVFRDTTQKIGRQLGLEVEEYDLLEHFHMYEVDGHLREAFPIFGEHTDGGALIILANPFVWTESADFARASFQGFQAEQKEPTGCSTCWLAMVGSNLKAHLPPVVHSFEMTPGIHKRFWVGTMFLAKKLNQRQLASIDCETHEIHCWNRCMEVEPVCLTNGKPSPETQCVTKAGEVVAPHLHADGTGPRCPAMFNSQSEKVQDPGFCRTNASRIMYMSGFRSVIFEKNLPCLSIYWEEIELNWWLYWVLAAVGIFFLVLLLECLRASSSFGESSFFFNFPLFQYTLVTATGYFLMFFPMTYSYELVVVALISTFIANFIFQQPAEPDCGKSECPKVSHKSSCRFTGRHLSLTLTDWNSELA